MTDASAVALPRFPGCFVCGPDNDHGLNLPFFGFIDCVEAVWTPARQHIGYAETIHGGLLSTVLDESVIWAAYHLTGRFGVTAELSVRYRKPVIVGHPVRVLGRMQETDKRLWTAEGSIVDVDGKVLVTAQARIHPLSEEKTREMLENLDHGISQVPL